MNALWQNIIRFKLCHKRNCMILARFWRYIFHIRPWADVFSCGNHVLALFFWSCLRAHIEASTECKIKRHIPHCPLRTHYTHQLYLYSIPYINVCHHDCLCSCFRLRIPLNKLIALSNIVCYCVVVCKSLHSMMMLRITTCTSALMNRPAQIENQYPMRSSGY